jgi:hypothetical protein
MKIDIDDVINAVKAHYGAATESKSITLGNAKSIGDYAKFNGISVNSMTDDFKELTASLNNSVMCAVVDFNDGDIGKLIVYYNLTDECKKNMVF